MMEGVPGEPGRTVAAIARRRPLLGEGPGRHPRRTTRETRVTRVAVLVPRASRQGSQVGVRMMRGYPEGHPV